MTKPEGDELIEWCFNNNSGMPCTDVGDDIRNRELIWQYNVSSVCFYYVKFTKLWFYTGKIINCG